MLAMKALRLQLGTLLAADASTLAPAANPNKIALIVAPFSLNENLNAASVTLASTNGLTPIAGIAGSQTVGTDPVTGAQVIQIKDPAGGYSWVTSGAFTGAITIYGFGLFDTSLATLLAAAALATPITVTAAGQIVDIDPATLTINVSPIS